MGAVILYHVFIGIVMWIVLIAAITTVVYGMNRRMDKSGKKESVIHSRTGSDKDEIPIRDAVKYLKPVNTMDDNRGKGGNGC